MARNDNGCGLGGRQLLYKFCALGNRNLVCGCGFKRGHPANKCAGVANDGSVYQLCYLG
jgi:hypothetical protein